MDAGVRRYDLASPTPASILPASRWGLDSLTTSADGQWLAASDNAGQRVALWPAGATNGAGVKFLRADNTGTGMIALSPDGAKIAVAYRYDPGLVILHSATGKILHRLELPPRHALAWSPDGRWLAACGTTAQLWDTETWERVPMPALESNHPPAGDVAFSWREQGGSKRLAVVTGGNRVTMIDLARREITATLEAPSQRLIYKLDFSPDDRWLAAACARGEIHLWDLAAMNSRIETEVAGQQVKR
jgi:WD40 repeat protein